LVNSAHSAGTIAGQDIWTEGAVIRQKFVDNDFFAHCACEFALAPRRRSSFISSIALEHFVDAAGAR
jgi:hypothetical protein